jgi:DNA-binding beta-propeller fold protein YncE
VKNPHNQSNPVGRRIAAWNSALPGGLLLLSASGLLLLSGCTPSDQAEIVWGRRGTQPGDFRRPRAIAIDAHDRLYIVDFTARIQVFDRDGKFLDRCWTTPDYRNGRPSGLSIDREGNLLLSDSHYHCLRIYSPNGQELLKIGGEPGTGPGQLGYISDAVQDEDGNFYIAEFGENHRISKFDANGKFLLSWGEVGDQPGQFGRLRALVLGPDRLLYVADATNHRIQVFTRDGKLVRCWGEPGSEPGQLSYPYDLAFGLRGELYVIERGNHRVQKFTPTGESLGCWGGLGGQPGAFNEPWALAVDSHGRVHVVDTENDRVQRIDF